MKIYREAVAEDLEQLIKIGISAYGQFEDILGNEGWNKMKAGCGNKETYIQLLKIARCFLCETENKVVGMAFLIPSGNPFAFFEANWSYIRLVGVLPECEGQGIGKKLTQLCIGTAKKSGEKIIALHTSEFQNAARHIYESLGFKKVKELDRIFNKRYWLYQLDLDQEIYYRRADSNDMESLIELRMQFTTLLTGITDPLRIQELKHTLTDYFKKTLPQDKTFWLLAFCKDQAVATAGLLKRKTPPNFKNLQGTWGYIVNVYTVPTFRRRGISRKLLEKLMEEGRKEGIHAFELHATEEGEFVYKQLGFEIHNEPTYRKYFK